VFLLHLSSVFEKSKDCLFEPKETTVIPRQVPIQLARGLLESLL